MVRIMIQVPRPLKAKFDAERKRGTSAAGFPSSGFAANASTCQSLSFICASNAESTLRFFRCGQYRRARIPASAERVGCRLTTARARSA